MNIVYRLIGTKEYKKVYVRLYSSKLSLQVPTILTSKIENWDFEGEQFKKNKVANKQLIQLKIDIEEAFNSGYSTGAILNKNWLKNIVAKTFARPNKEEKLVNHGYTIFLGEFASYWMKNHSETWKNSSSEVMTNKAKTQKLKAIKQFEAFQIKTGTKVELVDFTLIKIKEFYDFLIEQEYSAPTAKKTVYEIKTFCKRAKEMNINVCLDFEEETIFKDKSTKIEDIYLNEQEIDSIFKYDFSENESMNIIRDNFILSLWTGKRISDLLNLSSENIKDGCLESIDIKTNTLVKVPLHPHVQFILSKRFGHLPPKVNKDEYNLQIKEICRLCNINTMTLGKVFDKTKKRKIQKYYEKYKLVTSHTARRSFATNLSRILSATDIATLGGWSGTTMVVHYNKESKSEVAKRTGEILNNSK